MKPYTKPEIKKEINMTFPRDIIAYHDNLNGSTTVVCKQCAACHGCRD